MEKNKLYFSLLLIVIFSGVLFLNSCDKEDMNEPPVLPPIESLAMDFSAFSDPSDTLVSKKTLPNYTNWGVAFTNVAFWNLFISAKLAVPVFAYAEALKHTPVYLGDSRWEWKYSITHNSTTFTASLQAERISNEEYSAEMFISSSGGFTNFKWFEGTLRYDRTSAFWTMYESPLIPGALLTADWNHNWETGEGDITYTNIKVGDPENESFISYVVDPLLAFDAKYMISLSTGQTQIEWNMETLEGRIKSPWFKNSEWHCWNQYLHSISCE